MPDDLVPRCTVLGSGTMGAQIALSLTLGSATVALWGRSEKSLDAARARIAAALSFLSEQELIDLPDEEIWARLTFTTQLEDAVSGAGFAIEAVVEDLETKQALLAQAERECVPETILSSTTSAIGAGKIQAALARPERFCIAHYAQPAHLVAVVEVVPGELTDPATARSVTELLERTGKAPVLCPDIPGFLWARIQHAVLREFATLVGKGLTTPEACDTILKQGYASRLPAMGAFEHADLAGLDLLNSPAAKAVWADLSNVADPIDTPVGELFAKGLTGMKSGKGFYDWSVRDPEEFKLNRDMEIVRRARISAEAVSKAKSASGSE